MMSWRADEAKPQKATPNKGRCKSCQLELRPVLLGSPSTVVTRQFIQLPVTEQKKGRYTVVAPESLS